MKKYYYMSKGKPCGPLTTQELEELLTDAVLSQDTLVAAEGATRWVKLNELLSHGEPKAEELGIWSRLRRCFGDA